MLGLLAAILKKDLLPLDCKKSFLVSYPFWMEYYLQYSIIIYVFLLLILHISCVTLGERKMMAKQSTMLENESHTL